jgi:hypothetical protein
LAYYPFSDLSNNLGTVLTDNLIAINTINNITRTPIT